MRNKKYLFGIGVCVSAITYLCLGYFTERSNFLQLISLFGILFAIYFLLLKYKERFTEMKWIMGIAIILRLLFLFVTPNLSDDYFRFIWDGRLFSHGNNPFLYLPSEINGAAFSNENNLTQELFNGLNSKNYYSCYPPVHQLFFGISTLISPNNILGSIIAMRLFIILAEIGTIILLIKLLKHFRMKENLFMIYAFNPLVIVELTGNLHFEGIVIFFLLLAFYLLNQNKIFLSAFSFSFAIGTKLLPLIFIPLLILKIGWKRGVVYSLLSFGILTMMFLPFLSRELLNNFFSSINLYFQKFEFNASIYYIVRWFGYIESGYNIIAKAGIVLSAISFISLLLISIFQRKKDWHNIFQSLLFSLTIYLSLSTTVHPWYIITLIMLCIFTDYRFPVLWSVLAILSYYTYHIFPHEENMWLVGCEYLLVGFFLFLEWKKMFEKRYFQLLTTPATK